MRLRELIKELQKAEKEHGDLRVLYDGYRSDMTPDEIGLYDKEGRGEGDDGFEKISVVFLH